MLQERGAPLHVLLDAAWNVAEGGGIAGADLVRFIAALQRIDLGNVTKRLLSSHCSKC
jgi:hypothetical protein